MKGYLCLAALVVLMLIGTATAAESHQQEKDINALENVEEEECAINEVSNILITMMSKIQH